MKNLIKKKLAKYACKNFFILFLEIHPLLNVKKPTEKTQKKVGRTKPGKPSKSEKSKHKYRSDEVKHFCSFKTLDTIVLLMLYTLNIETFLCYKWENCNQTKIVLI